jgi:hypothetical protein
VQISRKKEKRKKKFLLQLIQKFEKWNNMYNIDDKNNMIEVEKEREKER